MLICIAAFTDLLEKQVLSLCSVPLGSCTTLQVFVTLVGGKGSWGAASELLEVAKQEESLLQKSLLLLEKKKSEFHGKQSINDYSASFLYELSFASVF